MERYPKIAKLINNIDIENYPAYKECVKGVAEITAFDEYYIPFLWEKMLSAVLKSCNIEVKYDTKQAVSNWIDAACMWNAEVYAPLAKEGYYPFPVSGDYYDFGFSRELGYLNSVTNPCLRSYIKAIALFEILRYYIKEEMPKPRYDVRGKLFKNELSFEEEEMWNIILGNWPVHIDWNFYDLQFDGNNFALNDENWNKIKTKCIIGIDEPLAKVPSKEEIAAISLWKNGLGDMSKYFSGEDPMPKKTRIATADSWKVLPMPDKHSVIRTDILVPAEAMNIIRKGHIPEAMEDHWFMYCDDSAIRYYRSWTGVFVYEAHYEKTVDGYKITFLKVNRSPDQYGETNDRRDYCMFMYLLLTEAGGDGTEFFDEYLSLR